MSKIKQSVVAWRERNPQRWAELNRKYVADYYARNSELVKTKNRNRYRIKKGIPLDAPIFSRSTPTSNAPYYEKTPA